VQYGLFDTLTHDASSHEYVFSELSGSQIVFNDFDNAVSPTNWGHVKLSLYGPGNSTSDTFNTDEENQYGILHSIVTSSLKAH
jgi:hypothetical protein